MFINHGTAPNLLTQPEKAITPSQRGQVANVPDKCEGATTMTSASLMQWANLVPTFPLKLDSVPVKIDNHRIGNRNFVGITA